MRDQSAQTNAGCPVLLLVDERYEGHEGVADELGEGFEVSAAHGVDEALAAIERLAAPIILAPHNLEPSSGVVILAKLQEQSHPFVGLLMVDEPDYLELRRFGPLPGVHGFIQRPLRPGVLGLHLRAAVGQRQHLLDAVASSRRYRDELKDLLSALRHELRGKLQSSVGLSKMLLEFEGDRLTDEGRDWLARMIDSGEALTTLTDTIVEYLRLSSRPLETAAVDIETLCEEVFDTVQRADPEGAARLTFQGPSYRVQADRRALCAAIGALVDNGVRFNEAPSPRVSVRVTPGDTRGEREDGFTIVVDDNGIGSPERVLAQLYGLFERYSVKHHPMGVGVGLPLAAMVARRHNGALWAQPAPDSGTRFSLYLPGLK